MQVDIDAAVLLDNLPGLAQDGQVGQAEEVHLQQADVGDILHGELGHHRFLAVALAAALQRHVAGQRLFGDDDAGGMGAGVAGDALHPPGGVNQVAHDVVLVVDVLQLGVLFQRPVQGHVRGIGHQPGHAVDIAVGHAQRPPHIPDGGPGAQRAEGDNLGDVVLPVLLRDIGDDLVAAVVLEVQVDIRHLLALDVEEALEDQLVLHGVDVGDAQAVQDDAGGGAAPHPEEDVVFPGEGDDVPDDQEIVGELGLLDDVQLVVQPLFYLRSGSG